MKKTKGEMKEVYVEEINMKKKIKEEREGKQRNGKI